MNTEDLLTYLATNPPSRYNPTPGLTPIALLRGVESLQNFTPTSENEKALLTAAEPMFTCSYSVEEHRAFRAALLAVYLEQGFKASELKNYFPTVENF